VGRTLAERMSATSVEARTADVQRDVRAYLQAHFPPPPGRELRDAPPQFNYFSITWPVDEAAAGAGVYIKSPRADLRGRPDPWVVTDADRDMADREAESLEALAERWPDSEGVRWVRLLGRIPPLNALITGRVHGIEALDWLRDADVRARRGDHTTLDQAADAMRRFGRALGQFHGEGTPAIWTPDRTQAKYDRDADRLQLPARLRRNLSGATVRLVGEQAHGRLVSTLKGIDLRNMLVGERGHLFILDPGRMKSTFREADLARFILTLRITHWGRWFFPLVGEPSRRLEASFLQGYHDAGFPPVEGLLRVFLLKEVLKHWVAAVDALAKRRLPPLASPVVRRLYIDHFYRRQLAAGLRSTQ
jgi:hypothetical protein